MEGVKNQFSIHMVSMRYFDGKMILLVICALVMLYTTFSNMNTLVAASPLGESEGYAGSEIGRTPVEYTRGGRRRSRPMTQMGWNDMVRYSYTHPRTKQTVNGHGRGYHMRRIPKGWADRNKLNVFGKDRKKVSFVDLLGKPKSHEFKQLNGAVKALGAKGNHTTTLANTNTNSINTLYTTVNATRDDVDDLLGRL
jgi:hypothetical protein